LNSSPRFPRNDPRIGRIPPGRLPLFCFPPLGLLFKAYCFYGGTLFVCRPNRLFPIQSTCPLYFFVGHEARIRSAPPLPVKVSAPVLIRVPLPCVGHQLMTIPVLLVAFPTSFGLSSWCVWTFGPPFPLFIFVDPFKRRCHSIPFCFLCLTEVLFLPSFFADKLFRDVAVAFSWFSLQTTFVSVRSSLAPTVRLGSRPVMIWELLVPSLSIFSGLLSLQRRHLVRRSSFTFSCFLHPPNQPLHVLFSS